MYFYFASAVAIGTVFDLLHAQCGTRGVIISLLIVSLIIISLIITPWWYSRRQQICCYAVVLGKEPTFDTPLANSTAQLGTTALLPCAIDYLGKYQVFLLVLMSSCLYTACIQYEKNARYLPVYSDH